MVLSDWHAWVDQRSRGWVGGRVGERVYIVNEQV